jgi:diguanylate cyclase (GGDEF)-like protein
MRREAAERDRLTGFLSRRAFEERYREESRRGDKEGLHHSLITLDIDHFKAVNDGHGHPIGDEVIRAVAETIRSVIGTEWIVSRFGGEEFVILLPGIEKEDSFLLAEKIRAAMDAQRSYRAEGKTADLKVTVSGGVASGPADGRTAGEIIRKADQALYRAKASGRNRVCIAQEERMATKTTHYTLTQLERLAQLAKEEGLGEAVLLREALDDLLIKYKVSDVET